MMPQYMVPEWHHGFKNSHELLEDDPHGTACNMRISGELINTSGAQVVKPGVFCIIPK